MNRPAAAALVVLSMFAAMLYLSAPADAHPGHGHNTGHRCLIWDSTHRDCYRSHIILNLRQTHVVAGQTKRWHRHGFWPHYGWHTDRTFNTPVGHYISDHMPGDFR